MKLWMLKTVKDWEPWYDRAFGFVVRAPSANAARKLAAEKAGDEGGQVWMDPKKTKCEELGSEGEPGVVLRDFASA